MSSTLTNSECRDAAFILATKIKSTDPTKHHRHTIPLIRLQESFAKEIREKSVMELQIDDPRIEQLNDIATDLVREGIQ